MKNSKGADISPKEAAQQIIWKVGQGWKTMETTNLGDIISVSKITDKQEVKLKEQLEKISQRVGKLLGMIKKEKVNKEE